MSNINSVGEIVDVNKVVVWKNIKAIACKAYVSTRRKQNFIFLYKDTL